MTNNILEQNNRLVKTIKDYKREIKLLTSCYVTSRRILAESEYGHINYPQNVINDCFKIVYHIDSVIESMDDFSRLFLENEIKMNKTGEWYKSYCSSTTYYNNRYNIYKKFLEELEK